MLRLLFDMENRKAAAAYKVEENKMKMKMNGSEVKGGVKEFRGKYVRELISGRKGKIEIGTKVCLGSNEFRLIVFRPTMRRFDLLRVR